MKRHLPVLLLGLLLPIALWCLHAADRLRLEDVVYLEDYFDKPVELKAVRATSLTFSRDGTGAIDTISPRQTVVLVGIGAERYLVRARVSTGRADGWVRPADMEPIPESIMTELEKKSAAAAKVKEAIAKGEIEIGMTVDDVVKILGTTKVKSQIKDASGSREEWTYTTYKTVYVSVPSNFNGTNYISTLPRKVPVSSKIVTFQNDKVTRYEVKDEDTTKYKSGQTVVPPIYVQ